MHQHFIRKTMILSIYIGIVVLLAFGYLIFLSPATEREKIAACRGLKFTENNTVFPSFPQDAPDFTVQDSQGNKRSLSSYRGKVVLLNFWATWCPPCVEEVPSLEKLQQDLDSNDFIVLAMASAFDWKDLAKFFPQGTPLTVLLDPPSNKQEILGVIAKAFGIPRIPETFLIDRQGKIRYYFTNTRTWNLSVAQTCIQALIDESN